MDTTITFDEKIKGWTSFHSFLPDWMMHLNNRFYTIKDGQLYRHNDANVPRNNFYGVSYPSKVSIVFNDNPSDIKMFKTLYQEGTQPWSATLTAYESDSDEIKRSTLATTEFDEKEGFWYAYARRNEKTGDLSSKATYGIGVPESINGNDVTYSTLPSSISVGDEIYLETQALVGTVTNVVDNVVTLSSTTGITNSTFTYGQKNVRIEGGQIRGYVMRADLENSDSSKRELYAVNTEVSKSYR